MQQEIEVCTQADLDRALKGGDVPIVTGGDLRLVTKGTVWEVDRYGKKIETPAK